MTSDQKPDRTNSGDPPAAPTVVVVGAPHLAERLREVLGDEGVRVVQRPADEAAPDDLREVDADLVVVRREGVDEVPADDDVLALADAEDGPDVLVVFGDDDPLDRTRLAAAGAAVLDEAASDERLGRDVAHLASSAEAGRGTPSDHADAQAPRLADFMTHAPRMRAFLDLVHRVAASDASLLLQGETGVGKSRLARAIHAESPRADEPFVEINCGAIPAELLESELFGAEAGAYTGARRARRGLFERAHRGTVFLDEIAELPPTLQVKLLGVLQRRRVQRLGAETARPVDVRVIAATNRDLPAEIAEGRFREDLFYRLNVVPLVVPPLREHIEDLPDLAGGFLRHFRETVPDCRVEGLDAAALTALMEHRWPGNVRELANVVERAVLLARGPLLTLRDLPESVRGPLPADGARDARGGDEQTSRAADGQSETAPHDPALFTQPLREARKQVVDAFERAYLEACLRAHEGRIAATAEAAGISTRALYDKLRHHGLRKEDFRPSRGGRET